MLERFDPDGPGRRNAAWAAFDRHHAATYRRAADHIASWWPAGSTVAPPVILDAACGLGYGQEYLGPLGHYIGVDRDPAVIAACERRCPAAVGVGGNGGNGDAATRAQYKVADLDRRFPLMDVGPVDVAVTIATAEHLVNPVAFLSSLCHLLAPRSGRLIFSAPTGLTMDIDPFHRHDLSASRWGSMLRRAGFDVLTMTESRFIVRAGDLFTMTRTTLRQKAGVAGFLLSHPRYLADRAWNWGVRGRHVWTSCFAVCGVGRTSGAVAVA